MACDRNLRNLKMAAIRSQRAKHAMPVYVGVWSEEFLAMKIIATEFPTQLNATRAIPMHVNSSWVWLHSIRSESQNVISDPFPRVEFSPNPRCRNLFSIVKLKFIFPSFLHANRKTWTPEFECNCHFIFSPNCPMKCRHASVLTANRVILGGYRALIEQ